MVILEENKVFIDKKFGEVLNLSGCKKNIILKGLSSCSDLEKNFMKFLYISMPLSDLANYDFDLFLSFAKHAIFLKENMPWFKKIPEDIFLNYVLHYRVNNENIENCRKVFYNLISSRISGKSMTEAALEVNYWCLEQMTYQSTDDRTMSPLTALRSAYGRCGEESTFAVTALRSVGIPARQIYAPKWSHCDDNHAWVEVWCNGAWHYLGACEPEPILDKGWFTASASRAMLITSKIFSPFLCGEKVAYQNEQVAVLNHIEKYADGKKITVQIIDRNNAPVSNIQVNFEVLNYSQFFKIASLKTNSEGKASITLGLGSININAVKAGKFINRLVNTAEEDNIVLNWEAALTEDVSFKEVHVIAPNENINLIANIKSQKNETAKARIEKSNYIRKQKEHNFYDEERVQKTPEVYMFDKENINNILFKAKGNYIELEKFLIDANGSVNNEPYSLSKLEMLKVLTDKDYLDITKNILDMHFYNSIIYKDKYPKDIFQKYIMNPRIYYEHITNYREFILNYFSKKQLEEFKEYPQKIWDYILNNIEEMPEKEYDELFTLPVGALEIKKCSIMSKKILFTAICRTIGIPARINKEDLSLEYYKDSNFMKINEENESSNASLILFSDDYTNWVYMQNWSLGVSQNGAFNTLNLIDREWINGKLTLELPSNNYRVITSNRIPNGSIFSKEYSFILKSGQHKELGISLLRAKITDMLKNVEISDFNLLDKQGNKIMAKDILNGNKNIVIWLEEGKEPTEHILNEMIMLKDVLNILSCNIIFVLKSINSLANEKLKETLNAIPRIKLYYDDSCDNVSYIARKMYLNPDELPLIIVTNHGLNVIYSFSGYNVGIIDLVNKIINSI